MHTQITPEEVATVLSDDLFSKVTSIGISGGEPTMRTDLSEIVDVAFRYLPRLRNVSLITNGLEYEVVTQQIERVAEVVKRHGGCFDVMVSIDGVGKVHDRVRRRPQAFLNASKSVIRARNNPAVDRVQIGCTVVKQNVFGLHDLLDWAVDHDIYVKFRLGIPHARLYTADTIDPYDLNKEERLHFTEFLHGLCQYYEQRERQIFFYRSLIKQVLMTDRRIAGCAWQHRGVTLSARGGLSYCAVASKILGDARMKNPSELFFANFHHRDEIIMKRCDNCAHDYDGIPPRGAYLRLLLMILRRRFHLNFLLPLVRDLRGIRNLLPEMNPTVVRFEQRNLRGVPRAVLLVGWYGTETLGDKAVLAEIIESLWRVHGEEMPIDLLTMHKEVSEITKSQLKLFRGVRLISYDRSIPMSSYRSIIFAGGPIMSIGAIRLVEAVVRESVQRRIPFFAIGIGVGPLKWSTGFRSVKTILESAHGGSFRDGRSLKTATRIARLKGVWRIHEDPAFYWVSVNAAVDTKGHHHAADERTIALFALRDWPWQEYAATVGRRAAERAKDCFDRAVIQTWQELSKMKPCVVITPFPMCTNHYGGDDRYFLRRLLRIATLPDENVSRVALSREIQPLHAVQLFSRAAIVVGMRYHSLVFAAATGTNAVAIDYTLGRGKVKSVARHFRFPTIRYDRITSEWLLSTVLREMEGPRRTSQIGINRERMDEVLRAAVIQ